jgi:hypothetical protein
MSMDDAGVYVAGETEIVRVDNEPAQDLEEVQLDGQELLGVGAEVLEQFVQFAG